MENMVMRRRRTPTERSLNLTTDDTPQVFGSGVATMDKALLDVYIYNLFGAWMISTFVTRRFSRPGADPLEKPSLVLTGFQQNT
jgi:hypothetical protein